MTPCRILVVDDHEVVRRGLCGLLEAQTGWQICGEAANGREAVEKAERLKPDIVVLDISMPKLNGLEAARRIRKVAPKIGVLILTMHDSQQVVRDVLDAGAMGYVLKSDAGRDLVAAVDALCQHRTFFTSKVARMVLDGYLRSHLRPSQGKAAVRDPLTAREREVLQLIAEGKSTKQVAEELGMSVKTAETHRTNIMRKLDLHSVGELIRYALHNKIVEA